MQYIPWRQINNWICSLRSPTPSAFGLGCGKCCYRYDILLKDDEAAMIRKFWSDAVEERGEQIYLRKIGKKCLFQAGKSCALQPLGLKPIACKVWPFYVSTEPIRDWDDGNYQAQFLCRGKEFFVYVNELRQELRKSSQYNDFLLLISRIYLHSN